MWTLKCREGALSSKDMKKKLIEVTEFKVCLETMRGPVQLDETSRESRGKR